MTGEKDADRTGDDPAGRAARPDAGPPDAGALPDAGAPPDPPGVAAGRSGRRRLVPRKVRRALLLTAWLAATGLLGAEIFVSVRNLLH